MTRLIEYAGNATNAGALINRSAWSVYSARNGKYCLPVSVVEHIGYIIDNKAKVPTKRTKTYKQKAVLVPQADEKTDFVLGIIKVHAKRKGLLDRAARLIGAQVEWG